MNINDPSNNLKRQLKLLDAKLTTDYKRVKASKNTDRAYNIKFWSFYSFVMCHNLTIKIPVL